MANPTWSATTSVRSVRIILPPPVLLALTKHPLPLFSFMAGSAFVRISTSYGTRPAKILCPRVSSRPSSKRVLENPGHLKMTFEIGLGETVSTNGRKCRIGPPILNICNLLWSSMLVEPSENLLLFESSKIVSSLQLPLRWNNADEKMIAGSSWSKRRSKLRQRSASCPPFLSKTWISAPREAIIPLSCSSPRLLLLGTFETNLFRRKLYSQTSPHIPRSPETATPPTRRLERRRKRSSVAEMLSKLARTLPPPPVLTRLAPPTRPIPGAKTFP